MVYIFAKQRLGFLIHTLENLGFFLCLKHNKMGQNINNCCKYIYLNTFKKTNKFYLNSYILDKSK